MARKPIIIVTFNYRLNIFGFGDGTEKNLALKDQRLAIEWVVKHIAGFGGDKVFRPTLVLSTSWLTDFATLGQNHPRGRKRWCRLRPHTSKHWRTCRAWDSTIGIPLPLSTPASRERKKRHIQLVFKSSSQAPCLT